MKKFLFLMLFAFAVSFSFAEEKTISFGETNLEEVMVVTNNSQNTLDKGIAQKNGGLIVYAKRVFPTSNSSLSIEFIEMPKIENAGEIKTIQIKGKSYGYVATVRLHLMASSGEKKTIELYKTPALAAEYECQWKNLSYIEDVKERPIKLEPVWPFNNKDLYIESIEFHMNGDDGKFDFNAQKISEISFIYDKANIDDDMAAELDEAFDVNSKAAEAIQKRKESKQAEKKALENREKAKMATETFDN